MGCGYYIHPYAENGWCYLASILDLHTKKIVGYSFSKSMTTELVIPTLTNAINVQQPEEGLILHTDLCSQYTSEDFEKAVKAAKIEQSFSRKGCPYENACIESFHATLKNEEVYQTIYMDFEAARSALFQYIESWYNRKQIHGAIDYLTPSNYRIYADRKLPNRRMTLGLRFILPTHFSGTTSMNRCRF